MNLALDDRCLLLKLVVEHDRLTIKMAEKRIEVSDLLISNYEGGSTTIDHDRRPAIALAMGELNDLHAQVNKLSFIKITGKFDLARNYISNMFSNNRWIFLD